jgi:iron complex outermembrane receptor protein
MCSHRPENVLLVKEVCSLTMPSLAKQCYIIGTAAALLLSTALPAWADSADVRGLADLSLEELANIQVTSVSKRPEPLSDAAASIFVITNEDIRRSGATTLPEALRLAPNLEVARIDARNYAITARGFNSTFSNKMLVLLDGRTVYSPLFSGVFWDAQDVVLEDIDRIEVISGPGSTLWGANAVNGVINIITKSAADTQGGLAAVGASKNEQDHVVRYGGAMANGGHYRVYGKYADYDDTQATSGKSTQTGWHRQQTGFRSDWGNTQQGFTVQGDAYNGALHQGGTPNIAIGGANLNGRMNQKLEDGSDVSIQAYWDYTQRYQPTSFDEDLNTFDLQLQQAFKAGQSHNIVWGGGYRLALDHVEKDPAVIGGFLPNSLNMHWGNVFAQDEIALAEKLSLTAGLKLENDNYTGTNPLPTLRLAWKPTQNNLIWSALSRTVRSPSRIDRDYYAPTNPSVVNGVPQYLLAGGPDMQSETANVLELGYRAQPTKTVSYSATVFYSRYNDLRTLSPNPNGTGYALINGGEGSSRGIEMWGTWQAMPTWRLSAGLVTQHISTSTNPGVTDVSNIFPFSALYGFVEPSNFWQLRSSHDIGKSQELDFTLRHSGTLSSPIGTPTTPAYTTMDVRYAWKIRRDLELSIVGQNLLDPKHAEFGTAPNNSEFERSVFIKLLWRQ